MVEVLIENLKFIGLFGLLRKDLYPKPQELAVWRCSRGKDAYSIHYMLGDNKFSVFSFKFCDTKKFGGRGNSIVFGIP
jgi:hypothetical protein